MPNQKISIRIRHQSKIIKKNSIGYIKPLSDETPNPNTFGYISFITDIL